MFDLNEKRIEPLKMIVNLSNVKHLEIKSSLNLRCSWAPHVHFNESNNWNLQGSWVLLELVKQMPQLCSTDINWYMLKVWLKNEELYKYLPIRITKFHISSYFYRLLGSTYNIDLLWEIFPNIEQFICLTEEEEFILFLLKNSPKLSCINAYSRSNKFVYSIS